MQLKHFFVFLLYLVISVAETTVYSLNSSYKYHQNSKEVHKAKFSYKNTKLNAFSQKRISDKYLLAFSFLYLYSEEVHQKHILHSYKLQKQLYQKIASLNIQHIFLNQKITSCNTTSTLYIV